MRKNKRFFRFLWIVLLICLAAIVAGCSDDDDRGGVGSTLNIIEPAAMQTLNTSNVGITISFNFSADSDRETFYAWLNEKNVTFLFHYTEDDIANGMVSAGDGLNASDAGPRENVLTAQVTGQNGAVYVQTIKFFVDCSGNSAPVAQAGREGSGIVFPGETVTLDGSGSNDADGDPLAYQWSLVNIPNGSHAELSNPLSVKPDFVPDIPGDYVAELVVDDYKVKSGPSTVTIRTGKLATLVDGEVQSPIFDILSRYATAELYDGSQHPSNYNLAILDAGNHDPEELYENKLVQEAFVDGTWVLALNVLEEHKKAGLVRRLGLVDSGESVGYLFRQEIESGVTPSVQILNLPPLTVPEGKVPETDDYLPYVETILKTLHPKGRTAPDNPIPDGLINTRWSFNVPVFWTKNWSGRHEASDCRVQTGNHNINYTFTLYLDNKDNWQGTKQYLHLRIDGVGDPTYGESYFMATDVDMGKNNEYGWFQDKLTVKVTPQDSFWIFLNDDPKSINTAYQFTSSASFGMQFNAMTGQLTSSFNYSNSETHTLSEWMLLHPGNASWEFYSQIPEYGEWNNEYSKWWYLCGKPKRPNDRSLNQTDYHAEVVWRTGSLINQIASFKVSGIQHITNTYCPCDIGTTCCISAFDLTPHYCSTIPYERTFSIDLGAVIPIEIAGITFDQYPVLVGPLGKTIKGTIILKDVVTGKDVQILGIKSNPEAVIHAAPEKDQMIIRTYSRAETFNVAVNSQGVPVGDTFSSYISAFYGQGYTQQLAMKAVDTSTSPSTPPSLSPEPSDWVGTVDPSETNWKGNFLVRYAVSFIYPGSKGTTVESPMGPWSDWVGPYTKFYAPELYSRAMPLLEGIPTDPTNTATGRKIYRQFFANYQAADPSAGVEYLGTLSDNTTTTFQDDQP